MLPRIAELTSVESGFVSFTRELPRRRRPIKNTDHRAVHTGTRDQLCGVGLLSYC